MEGRPQKNICGISYQRKNLTGKNFQNVQAGQKIIQKILLAFFGISLASLCSIIDVCSATLIAFDYSSEKNSLILALLKSVYLYTAPP